MNQGLQLMLVGMGFVFAFLSIMVVCMHAMSAIVAWYNKIFPEAKHEIVATVTGNSHEEIAAVIAAVKHLG